MGDKWKEPRIPADRLKWMAVEYAERRAWLIRDVPEADRSMVFVPLMLLTAQDRKDLLKHTPVEVYGHIGDAGIRAVNGFPMFFALTWIYAQDFFEFAAIVNRLRAAKEEALR